MGSVITDTQPISGDTLRAYLETDYWVERVPAAESFALRVGEPCEPMKQFAVPNRASGAAFITAYNPLGIATDERANQQEQAALAARLEGCARNVLPGEGRGRIGDWPAEPSWLALGIDFDDACRVGREFGQNAIIWVGSDYIPALVVLRGGV